MKPKIRKQLANRKQRIERRLDKTKIPSCQQPVFTARDIHYEIADRTRGIASGGLGALHALARQVGLIDAIDEQLHLLKFHLPYHESDHVLTFAYNALCDGTCREDLELRRQDEVFLDALGDHETLPALRGFTADDGYRLICGIFPNVLRDHVSPATYARAAKQADVASRRFQKEQAARVSRKRGSAADEQPTLFDE